MKLGTETGNVWNHLMAGGTKPKVGMGATRLMWTDRHAGTIVKITPTQVHVQEDTAKRTDGNGMSEDQQYEYSPNSQGAVHVFRKTKRGYRNKGGNALCIGERDSYHDYSF